MRISEVVYTICNNGGFKPYPDQMPEPQNGIVYTMISNKRNYSLSGDSKFHTAIFQISVFNTSKGAADEVASDIIDLFHQSTGLYNGIRLLTAQVTNEEEDYEEETQMYAKFIELTFQYKVIN